MSNRNLHRIGFQTIAGMVAVCNLPAALATTTATSTPTMKIGVVAITSGPAVKAHVVARSPAPVVKAHVVARSPAPVVKAPVVAAAPAPVAKAPVVAASTTPVKTAVTAASKFGDYYTPFAADSLWNSRPVGAVLGTFVIPKSSYYPAFGAGAYSTGVFLAKDTDPPMVIYPLAGRTGVTDQDNLASVPTITIPHWPAETLAATGNDGHADIVDPTTGIIHSFFALKQLNGKWSASMYTWMPLGGTGWGDPAHYYQGARATGIPASAGLIRRHELDDGKPTYMHALAMSLTYNALSASPAYIYPATSADTPTSIPNTGAIPEGARMMLPPDYDTTKIANPKIRKIADTLKLYGAYVVDRNTGTPFYIYSEILPPVVPAPPPPPWDSVAAAELQRIRMGLRQVIGATSWVDGNNVTLARIQIAAKTGNLALTNNATPAVVGLTPPSGLNLLSMRGPWTVNYRKPTTVPGVYNSWTQTMEFAPSPVRTYMSNGNGTGFSHVAWARMGGPLRLTSTTTGGATLRVVVYNGSTVAFNSGEMPNGKVMDFTWPAGGWATVYATNGISGEKGSVQAHLVAVQ